MANAHETARHDVEEETTQKLVGWQGHLLGSVGVGVVLVGEAHDAIADETKTTVGDGDAVRVAAQVLEHPLWTAEGWLGIDDPVRLPHDADEALPSSAVRRTKHTDRRSGAFALVQTLETGEILAPKESTEGADGKQEARPACGHPAVAVQGKSTAGDDAVYVRMLGEDLSPGVQDHGDGELGTEVSVGEASQRVRGDVEEQPVEAALVDAEQRIEEVR